jgi:hypothetical protein
VDGIVAGAFTLSRQLDIENRRADWRGSPGWNHSEWYLGLGVGIGGFLLQKIVNRSTARRVKRVESKRDAFLGERLRELPEATEKRLGGYRA